MTVVGASTTGVAKFASTLTLKTCFEDLFFYPIPVSDMTCFTKEVLRVRVRRVSIVIAIRVESSESFLFWFGVIEDF